MMFADNFSMALTSIRSNKLRSFLTLLGVIIGVSSVITSVSIGEGVKRQVSSETAKFGSDVLTIRPGKLVADNEKGLVAGLNVIGQASTTTAILTENDMATVSNTKGVAKTIPVGLVSGLPTYNKRSFDSAITIGTSSDFPTILSQKIEFGRFFSSDEQDKRVAVIGQKVAENLFGENVPLSKSFEFRGQEFIVYGVFERFKTASFSQGIDFNNAIFIPYASAKNAAGGNEQFYEILAKVDNVKNIDNIQETITDRLTANHAGQTDFSILKTTDTQSVASDIIDLITVMIGGIAAISMLVGGIGIMNVMLVSVTERTREIGLRKAVGATNRQILSQFMIEATVLSIWGAIIGVFFSGLINIAIRIFSNLQPTISWQVVVFASGISIIVGIVFGLAPAFKASRKDPIESLRADNF